MKKKAKSIFLTFQFREFGIPYYVILGLDPRISVLGNFKFICDEIPRSSRGMIQGLGILEFLGKIPPNPQKLSKERMRSKKIGILLLGIMV